MQAGSVSLTYTHTTLSIISETIEDITVPPPARRPTILNGNSQPARDVSYTPASSSSLEDALAAFYTAAIGGQPFPTAYTASNASYIPDPSTATASGTLIQAAQQSLGAFIDILA